MIDKGRAGSGKTPYGTVREDCADVEAFLTGVLDSLHVHVAVLERDGSIIAVNEAWRRFARENDAGSAEDVSEGADYLDICRQASDEGSLWAHRALEGIRKVLDGEESFFSMEYPCSSPDEERWFLMHVVPLRRPGGGAVVVHANITRRKKAEENLLENERRLRSSREEYRELARKLISAQEDARRRLARELHDGFSQRLAILSMHAAKVEIEGADRLALAGSVGRIQDEIARLSADIHDVARQLHPQIIEDLGLADALQSYVERFSKSEGIETDFKCGDIDGRLPLETALNLYRIAQESLSNVAKHARAGHVKVSLDHSDGMLRLSIRDDGVGFDLEAVRGKRRLGLVTLRERASLIGGKLSIISAPGAGTEVSVEVPEGR